MDERRRERVQRPIAAVSITLKGQVREGGRKGVERMVEGVSFVKER